MKKRKVQAMLTGMAALLTMTVPAGSVYAAAQPNTVTNEVVQENAVETGESTDATDETDADAQTEEEQKPSIEKSQTVYVNADESGDITQVLVSNWLKNVMGDKTIADQSSLKDIENVKGDETYTDDGNGDLVWDAEGADIYYQGKTDKELPVSVKLTYYLDGKEIKPKDLAGKSGKVKIRIDYTNHSQQTVDINGKEETVCTPFLMTTGMILPSDNFSNVEVTNGKVISDGEKSIVIGVGFPGLADSLKLNELDELKDPIDIPDYVEITADAKDFKLDMTMTVASTGLMEELGIEQPQDLDDLKDDLTKLSDSSTALVEGADALKDGINTLDSSADTFVEGINSVDSGVLQLKNGIDEMNSKKGELVDGMNELNAGIKKVDLGAGALQTGVSDYTSGVTALKDGLSKVSTGAATLNTGLSGYTTSVQSLSDNLSVFDQTLTEKIGAFDLLQNAITNQIAPAVGTMSNGATQFQNGAKQVSAAAANISTQMSALNQGLSGAEQYMAAAQGAIDAVQMPADDLEKQANAQAKEAADAAASNAYADAKAQHDAQKSAVSAALDSIEGLTSEQKASVMSCLGDISSNVDGGTVSISLEGANPDNSAATQTLAGTKAGLEKIQGQMAAATLSTTDIDNLKNGADEAANGAATMKSSLGTMKTTLEGMSDFSVLKDTLLDNVKQLDEGAQTICSYNDTLTQGGNDLVGAIGQLKVGASTLTENNKTLNSGASQLKDGTSQLSAGGTKLTAGATTLSGGITQLADGASQLKDGTTKLSNGGTQLQDGVGKLSDGAATLASGMAEFDEEGIQKLTSMVDDNVQVVLDRLDAVLDADKNYTSFDGTSSDMDGSVKFIIETKAISDDK